MTERACACPCRKPVVGGTARTIYAHPDTCKQRAYRARLAERLEAAGLPARLNLKLADTQGGAGNGLGDPDTSAPPVKRQRKPEVRLPYRRVLTALTDALDPDTAATILSLAVPARARETADEIEAELRSAA